MESWEDIRDLAERVLDDGGCSSNYIAEAADCAIELARSCESHAAYRMATFVAASLQGECEGCCNWERVARVCEGIIRDTESAVWQWQGYDPKAEGARKLAEGWPK